MGVLRFLLELGENADQGSATFHAAPLYVVVCVAMPVAIGLVVGFGTRALERVLGIQLGKAGH